MTKGRRVLLGLAPRSVFSQMILTKVKFIFLMFFIYLLRHIGLLEADEDKIRKIQPKGTLFRIQYGPREAIRP